MTSNYTHIKVFASCPGDVSKEKAKIKQICAKISNSMQDAGCNIQFEVKDWKDIVGEYGTRPQAIINQKFNSYDIYLGVFHMRFGSPTNEINPVTKEDFGSGTYEEFTIACKKKDDDPNSILIFMFFKEPIGPKNLDEMSQLEKVLKLKDEIGKKNWVNEFKKTADFAEKVDRILTTLAAKECLKKKELLVSETIQQLNDDKKMSVDVTAFSKDANIAITTHYIERSVTSFKKIQSRAAAWVFEKKIFDEDDSLKTALLKYKRVVLLGNAGSGKSTELTNLIKKCHEKQLPFIPVYRRFNTYVEQTIQDFLPKGWNDVPSQICLVVLDGLDEVQPQHLFTAIRNIQSFVDNNPSLSILISSRTNFYQLTEGNGGVMLPGFEVFFLDDFSVKAIEGYVQKNEIADSRQFVNTMMEEGLRDIIGIPFFLEMLITEYQKSGVLLKKREELFESIIQSRIVGDEVHFQTTVPLGQRRVTIISLLERVALVMESMGANVITLEQLREVLSQSHLELLQYFPAFKKVNNNDELWGFEHNNIQEYLASRALSSQSIETIKDFVSLGKGHTRIKHSWVNTLSFLVSHSKENLLKPLLEWLIAVEPHTVVKFEPDRVPFEIREEIFYSIFNEAKKHSIWIRSNKFSEKELANFAQSNKVFEFLIEQLDDSTNKLIILKNSLWLLRYFCLDALQLETLSRSLLELFNRYPKEFDLIHITLYVIRDQFSEDKKLIEAVMKKLGHYTNQYVRAGVYALLLDSPYLDKYVDYLIEGISVSEKNDDSQRTSVNLADESWNLQVAFKNIKEPAALIKVIDFFAHPYDRRSANYYERTDVLKGLIENAINGYSRQPLLYDSVLKLFLLHSRFSVRGTVEIIRPFFDQTNTRIKAFKDIWNTSESNTNHYEKRIALLNITNKEAIDEIMQEYDSRNVTNVDIKNLYNDLSFYKLETDEDKQLVKYFERLINEKTSIDISEPTTIDYQAKQRARNQHSFELLFDKNGFVSELKRFYTEMGVNEVNFNNLWEFNRNRHFEDPEDYFARSVLDLLRDWTRNQSGISLDEVLAWISVKENFTSFAMNEICQHLKNYHEIVVSDDQRSEIEKWSNEAMLNIPDKTYITESGDDHSFSVNGTAMLVWFFMYKLGIKLSEETLLNFTLFIDVDKRHQDYSEFDILKKHLDKKMLDSRVVQNLTGDISFWNAWRNNCVYAIQEALTEAYSGIRKGIMDKRKFINDRIDILKLYVQKTKDYNILKDIIQSIEIDEVFWNAKDLWLKYKMDTSILKKSLVKIMQSNAIEKEYRWRAAQQLIDMGDEEAFYYYTDLILNQTFQRDEVSSKMLVISKVSNIAFLPRLMELIKLSKDPEYSDPFRSFDYIVISGLKTIALQSEDNLKKVTESIEKFINENLDLPNIQFMRHAIDDFEFSFSLQESQRFNLGDVIKEVNKIRPEILL
jgi:hypothetical protein